MQSVHRIQRVELGFGKGCVVRSASIIDQRIEAIRAQICKVRLDLGDKIGGVGLLGVIEQQG